MANIGKLVAVVTANSSQFESGMSRAMRSIDQFDKSLNQVRKATQFLAGGGALAGMSMAATKLAATTDSINQTALQLGRGQITTAEAAEQTVRGLYSAIPIVGGLANAYDDLRKMLDGTTAAMVRQAQADQAWKEWRAGQAVLDKARDSIEGLDRQFELMNKTAEEREAIDAAHDYADALKKAAAMRRELSLTNAPDTRNGEQAIAEFERKALALRDLRIDSARTKPLIDNLERARQMLADLDDQAKNFGQAGPIVELLKIGATQEQIAEAQRLLDKLDGMKQAADNARKITEAMEDLQDQVNRIGLSDQQNKLLDLQKLGATPQQIAEATRLYDELAGAQEALEERQSLQSFADSVVQQTQTPLDAFEQQMERLEQALAAGMLSWETYERAVRAAEDQLLATQEAMEMGSTAAIERGSGAAFTAERTRLPFYEKTRDRTREEALAEARKQTSVQEQTRDLLRNTVPVTIVGMN